MPSLEELVQPGRAAILTMEMQRAVVGDLTSLRALADVIGGQGVPARLGGLVESAHRAEVPVIHCRAAFAAGRGGAGRFIFARLHKPQGLFSMRCRVLWRTFSGVESVTSLA